MHLPIVPAVTFADQFEERSRELFLRFRRAAKARLAASQNAPAPLLPLGDDGPIFIHPEHLESSNPVLQMH